MNLFTVSDYTNRFHATGVLAPAGMVTGAIIGFVFGSPVLFWIFLGMLIMDTITGLMAALQRCERINSERARNTFFKLMAYLSILLVAACLDILLITYGTGAPWIKAAALGWIVFSEGISVLENCEVILGREIPFLGKIKKLRNSLKK